MELLVEWLELFPSGECPLEYLDLRGNMDVTKEVILALGDRAANLRYFSFINNFRAREPSGRYPGYLLNLLPLSPD